MQIFNRKPIWSLTLHFYYSIEGMVFLKVEKWRVRVLLFDDTSI